MTRPTSWILAALALWCVASAAPAGAQCAGDCNGDGQVSINELITGVNIALGSAAASSCAAVDGNGDGEVSISELISAVNSALGGCVSRPTPTATRTATAAPTGPTPTRTATPPIGGTCGNGVVELNLGETCDDGNTVDSDGCPSNCRVAVCPPSGQRVRYAVDFDTGSPDVLLQSLLLFIRYPDGDIDVPGKSTSEPVLDSVTSDLFAATPNDFDYALRVLLEDPSLLGYSDGTAMTVEFEVCQGASAPPASALRCTVEAASDPNFVEVPGPVSCTIVRR